MAERAVERVLVTAASGATARHLIARLHARGVTITAAGRTVPDGMPADVRAVAVGTVGDRTDWTQALAGATHVVHVAALTVLGPGGQDADFDAVNHRGTRRLAEQAATSGVCRFVQVSTAAVNGRRSGAVPIEADGPTAPANAYARSKLAAEAALWEVAAATGLEVVVVRPPRIVWPELTGNLRLFERLIAKGVPLPLGAIDGNARDNVSPDNLCAILEACLTHPGAPEHVFFATDDDPLSTRVLAERIAGRGGRRARLVPVPPAILRAVVAAMPARLLGGLNRREMASELLDNFRLDVRSTRSRLGWKPMRGTL